MSDPYVASLYFTRKQIGMYFGIPVFIAGVLGEILSITVLLSLKTFRQNSCGFYLLAMSIFNFIRLSLSTVFIIAALSFGLNYSISIFFFCQWRNLTAATCSLGSMTCLCAAVIDQYFATCTHPRWQQWSNIRVAHRMTAIITLIWLINGIPYVIFFDKISPTNTAVCISANTKFLQYHTYGYFLTYNSLVPLITIVFGLMAFHNVRNMRYRPIPLVRHELEKQLTVMVLVQTVVYVCAYLPFSIVSTISALNTNLDPLHLAKMNLANAITIIFSVISNGSSFYTYICVSSRFRRQLHYVLYQLYLVRCYTNRIIPRETDS